MIPNERSRDPWLAKRCLNLTFTNCLTKQNQKSNAIKWYTTGNFQDAQKLLDNGCPQLEEGINYKAISLKWYQRFLMPPDLYPAMNDSDHANWHCTILPSVPPADDVTPVPPPSPICARCFHHKPCQPRQWQRILKRMGVTLEGC
jgi:hypothetical protein